MTPYLICLSWDSLREKIADGWVLNSIENMLKAGVMEDGIVHKTTEGTPQGGVISPLLDNLVGDIIDKELEKARYKHVVKRANPFVRYADNFVVTTKTKEELPAAHAEKIYWPISEQDTFDILSLVPLVHRTLGKVTKLV